MSEKKLFGRSERGASGILWSVYEGNNEDYTKARLVASFSDRQEAWEYMKLQNQITALEAEVKRLRNALEGVKLELGVPGPDDAAPVTNTYNIANEALKAVGNDQGHTFCERGCGGSKMTLREKEIALCKALGIEPEKEYCPVPASCKKEPSFSCTECEYWEPYPKGPALLEALKEKLLENGFRYGIKNGPDELACAWVHNESTDAGEESVAESDDCALVEAAFNAIVEGNGHKQTELP